jgi:methylase of polypeptide subunit release factors
MNNTKELSLTKIKVIYTDETNGAGDLMLEDLFTTIRRLYPNRVFNHCLEWCSGPGFIGFGLLDQGICKNISLSDVYEPAKELVNQTIKENNLTNVNFYLSNNFDNIPKGTKFDLIIGNPPWFSNDPYAVVLTDPRRYKDTDWQIHQDFFNNAKDYLTKDGVILLLENVWGSGVSTFEKMILNNGFEFRHMLNETYPMDMWYLEVTYK